MNPYLCGVFGFLCQDCVVKIESQFVIVDWINHLFKVLCPHSEDCIVLDFRGCSEATELGFGTIHDLTLSRPPAQSRMPCSEVHRGRSCQREGWKSGCPLPVWRCLWRIGVPWVCSFDSLRYRKTGERSTPRWQFYDWQQPQLIRKTLKAKAATRSRLRICWISHRLRFPVFRCFEACKTRWRSMSSMRAWMVPLCSLGIHAHVLDNLRTGGRSPIDQGGTDWSTEDRRNHCLWWLWGDVPHVLIIHPRMQIGQSLQILLTNRTGHPWLHHPGRSYHRCQVLRSGPRSGSDHGALSEVFGTH